MLPPCLQATVWTATTLFTYLPLSYFSLEAYQHILWPAMLVSRIFIAQQYWFIVGAHTPKLVFQSRY